jgi:hypothetical protein
MKIDQKITGFSVKSPDTPEIEKAPEPIVVQPTVKKKLKRPDILWGVTVKVTTPDCNIYTTVNCDESGRPLEIFFFSSHLESQEWVALATRLASSMLRSNDSDIGSLPFISREFIKTESPGKYLAKIMDQKKGEMTNGVIAHLGKTLHEIDKRLKAKAKIDQQAEAAKEVKVAPADIPPSESMESTESEPKPEVTSAGTCPECYSSDTRLLDGCLTCMECSYSKCG